MQGQARPLFLRLFSLLLLGSWLVGCATVAPPTATNGKPDASLQQRLATLQHWNINGKLAVRSTATSESARLQWQQNGEQFDIHLSGPAGLKATRIHGTPHDVNFEQGEQTLHADSIAALSQQLVGWSLPADKLTWWLRGLPAPDSTPQRASYAPEGWLVALAQDGWDIRFSDPQQPRSDITLPGRIEATRGDTRITLIIKTWQFD
jgi:outer membrane lipoprotein LolB